MNTNRPLVGLGVAVVIALASSTYVYRQFKQASTNVQPVATQPLVVAAVPLQLGARLDINNLRIISWPSNHPVPGMFTRIEDCANRALITPLAENEAILESKLAPKESGAGLPATIPEGMRAAFEFRHPSWHDDSVFAALKRRNVALCVADSDKMSTPVVATADYAYFRLRDEGYQRPDIERWATVIKSQSVPGDAFVYFKHEEQGKGPEFAKMLMELL